MSMGAGDRPGSREKARRFRERQRARGLRSVQIWVPNTRSPDFDKEAHRQSLAVSHYATAGADQAFIDAISNWDEV